MADVAEVACDLAADNRTRVEPAKVGVQGGVQIMFKVDGEIVDKGTHQLDSAGVAVGNDGSEVVRWVHELSRINRVVGGLEGIVHEPANALGALTGADEAPPDGEAVVEVGESARAEEVIGDLGEFAGQSHRVRTEMGAFGVSPR
jgi:hypothetical protein